MQTIRAVVRAGRIETLEEMTIPEGAEVLVIPLPEDAGFWDEASRGSLDLIWGNPEDDVYAELLKV